MADADVTRAPLSSNSTADDVTLAPLSHNPIADADVTRAPLSHDSVADADVTRAPLSNNSIADATRSPLSSNSITEADATRVPMSMTSSPVDVTQVPSSSSAVSRGATYGGATEKTVKSEKSLKPAHPVGPPPSPAATGTQVGRFALKGLHARGGLGEVFTARDTELNREVAVKRIQSRYADDPASRRRFLTEAEITARLDHPGIVPVFGLVVDGFGRPCYAMRFIRGETLKDEIERYHAGKRPSTEKKPDGDATTVDPDDRDTRSQPVGAALASQPRSVAFRHLLQRFIAVCQAIGYAHTRKVIHRDIKPANVMVGTFGETLVVDWGLAKALDDSPSAEQLLRAASANGLRHDPEATELPDHMTMAGTAVGTPAYMAPEQASGRIDIIGPEADIYSLGATLYAILTGKSPFSGNATETLDKVRRGEFPPPQALDPEVPPPLDAVCRKAMALQPENRYHTALDLAADVDRWLSDEPVSCYPDPFGARLARWARRHPARVAASVSLLLAGGLAAAGVAWAVNEGRKDTQAALIQVAEKEKETAAQRDQVALEQGRTKSALDLVTKQKAQTEEQHAAAQAARDVARARYDAAVKTYNTLVFDMQRRLGDRAGNEDLRRNLLLQAQEGLQGLIKDSGVERIGADRTLVAAYRQLGDVYLLLGNTREARKEYETARNMAIEVLTKAQERRAAADEWAARRALGQAYLRLANVHIQAGNTTAAKSACENGLDLINQAIKARPTDEEAREDLAAAQDQLAEVLIERGETSAAAELCRSALDIRRKLASEPRADLDTRRRVADSLEQYADILFRAGHGKEAAKVASECLTLRMDVHKEHSRQPEIRRELASAHALLGEVLSKRIPAQAEKEYQAAIGLLKELLLDDPRSAGAKGALALNYGRLAMVKLQEGELDAAYQDAKKSNELCKEVDKDDADSKRTTRYLALSHEWLGDVLLALDKPQEALTEYRESVHLLGPLEEQDSESILAKRALAHALEREGEARLATGDAAAAANALMDSVALREKVLAVDNRCGRAMQELALGLGWLADARRAIGNFPRARTAITRSVALLRQVVDTDKDNDTARRELAAATGKWGEVLAENGQNTAALITELQSIDQFRELSEADKEMQVAKADLAGAWERMASLYSRMGQIDPSIAASSKAMKLRSEVAAMPGGNVAARRELALAMIRTGDVNTWACQFEAARKWYDNARQLRISEKADSANAAIVRRAEDKLALLDAVEQVSRNSGVALDNIPPAIRVSALRLATEALLRRNQPVDAAGVAWLLASTATAPEDRYLASLALVRLARGTYADEAVKALELAVQAGFDNVEALGGRDWDPCRNLPAFQKIVSTISTAPSRAPHPRPHSAVSAPKKSD
jgi:serine/threonine protein kinase/tetratricopeptide (TPR) repeat protein